MTFVRVTRDQRGYETTFLLQSARPGERPRVLYWYRTAPGVRVGRSALDEEAIRNIEEQHPEIDFDWPQLLEEAQTSAPEIEHRPERRRRPPRPRDESEPELARTDTSSRAGESGWAGEDEIPSAPTPRIEEPARGSAGGAAPDEETAGAVRAASPRNPVLEQLVGREIAARLRARYADLAARIAQLPDDERKRRWQERADALDPDRWLTSEAVLHGVQQADHLYDVLREELAQAGA